MNREQILRDFPAGKRVSVKITAVEPYILHTTLSNNIPAYITRPEALLTQKKTNLQGWFKKDDLVTAVVVGFNKKYKTLELSIRQALKDPWPDYLSKHSIGDSVTGEVIIITENKALIEIEPGITGLLPISESWLRKERMEDILMVEDRVRASIIKIRDEEKLLLLSVRDLYGEEIDDYRKETTFPIADSSGDILELLHYKENKDIHYDIGLKPATLRQLKSILVIDEQETIALPLSLMLETFGFEAQFKNANSLTTEYLNSSKFDLYIANIQAYVEESPVIPWLQNYLDHASLLIYAHPDQIESSLSLQPESGNKLHFLILPFSEQKLAEALNTIASGGSLPLPLTATEGKSAFSAVPLGQDIDLLDIDQLIDTIHNFSGASLTVIFQLDLNSNDVTILKSSDPELSLTSFDIGHLQFSPVRDVIFENSIFNESEGATKLKYLECLGKYESAIGIKIEYIDKNGYCLFIFAKRADHFSRLSKEALQIYELALRTALEKRSMQKNMLSMQKFIISGRITFSLMHETKNQLQALHSWLRVLKSNSVRLNRKEIKPNDEAFLARYQRAVDGAIAVENKTRQIEELFLNLLRESGIKTVDLARVIEELGESLSSFAKELRINIEIVHDKVPVIRINEPSLHQILTNLFINSFDFIPIVRKRTGKIKINIAFKKEKQRPIIISYWDNGPGVHYRNKEKIFEMFFTTKADGTGLGLYISRTLAESMGGILYLKESYRLSESTFVLELPFEPMGGQ